MALVARIYLPADSPPYDMAMVRDNLERQVGQPIRFAGLPRQLDRVPCPLIVLADDPVTALVPSGQDDQELA